MNKADNDVGFYNFFTLWSLYSLHKLLRNSQSPPPTVSYDIERVLTVTDVQINRQTDRQTYNRQTDADTKFKQTDKQIEMYFVPTNRRPTADGETHTQKVCIFLALPSTI